MTDPAPQQQPAPAQVQSKQDTPLSQPPTHLERWTSAIGNLARPFAIYSVAGATSAAIVGQATPDKVGAAGLILAALAGAKAYENAQAAKQDATVKVAQAQSTTTP